MVLADSNVWLALALSKHVFHQPVRAWFDRLTLPETACFCRATQQSFLRLLTTSAVVAPYGIPPLSNNTAWTVYADFLADKRISWAKEPPRLESRWRKLAASKHSSPKLWMDAYLAAFALAGDFRLVTTDKAFQQFKGLDLLVLG
jgi:toxin-antitoxin system PIN domain toxin